MAVTLPEQVLPLYVLPVPAVPAPVDSSSIPKVAFVLLLFLVSVFPVESTSTKIPGPGVLVETRCRRVGDRRHQCHRHQQQGQEFYL